MIVACQLQQPEGPAEHAKTTTGGMIITGNLIGNGFASLDSVSWVVDAAIPLKVVGTGQVKCQRKCKIKYGLYMEY